MTTNHQGNMISTNDEHYIDDSNDYVLVLKFTIFYDHYIEFLIKEQSKSNNLCCNSKFIM